MTYPEKFVQQLLTNAKATLYTVPTAKYIIIKQVVAVDISGAAAQNWTLFLGGIVFVPNAAVLAAPQDGQRIIDCYQVLTAGQLIEGNAQNLNAVNLFISGLIGDEV